MKSSTLNTKYDLTPKYLFTATLNLSDSGKMNQYNLNFTSCGATEEEGMQGLKDQIDTAIAALTLVKKQMTD